MTQANDAKRPSRDLRRELSNADVAAAFDEMAQLLTIAGESRFRAGAYERAAEVLRTLQPPLKDMGGVGGFEALPGIGHDLAQKIGELLRTGRMSALTQLRRQVPGGLRALLALPGLGPARVRLLHRTLGVRGIPDLKRAIAHGKLASVRGLGPTRIARLSAALSDLTGHPRRWLWTEVDASAQTLCRYLRQQPGVDSVDPAGSYRRGSDTVGDLDVVVTARGALNLRQVLTHYEKFRELTIAGRTRCSIVLRDGLQVDVRLVAPRSRGAALYYLTGSRGHSVRLRKLAVMRGLKLNEYGLYRGSRCIAGRSEEEILDAMGLAWIPPELREDRGEIAAAARGALPRLVTLSDLRGDLHAHTRASDGRDSLAAMAGAARALGLRYVAITDHSRHLGITHGLDSQRIARQIDEIDALNETLGNFVVLKGAEVDILGDGRLALPTATLRRLDVVVIAVHSQFDLTRARQTQRLLRALEHPCVSILAHPTGRLLNQRPAYDADFEQVIAAARERGCFLEINSQPDRLDLDDTLARSARDQGVLLSIASDAHSSSEFADLSGGVRQARRAWLGPEHVLNARPLPALRRLLAHARR